MWAIFAIGAIGASVWAFRLLCGRGGYGYKGSSQDIQDQKTMVILLILVIPLLAAIASVLLPRY